ncbi:hypothetical protein [Streptosporangium vulgare]|uniref:hypothetical protein n=1 Tax=Streptosporangium vulgare TaxID=46190 RepID=UPI003376F166
MINGSRPGSEQCRASVDVSRCLPLLQHPLQYLGAEGLGVSLAAANAKLTQLDERSRRASTINLEMPAFPEIIGRTANPAKGPP